MKSFIPLALLPLLASASPFSSRAELAPLHASETHELVEDSYIVVFKDSVKHDDASAHHRWVQDLHTNAEASRFELRKRSQIPIVDTVFSGIKHTFNVAGSLMGYAGHFDEETLDEIRRHPDVST